MNIDKELLDLIDLRAQRAVAEQRSRDLTDELCEATKELYSFPDNKRYRYLKNKINDMIKEREDIFRYLERTRMDH